MEGRYIGIFPLTLLIAILIAGCSTGRTIVVDDDLGSWAEFNKIQDAINASDHGDLIRIYAGLYNESVQVNRTLSLEGNGSIDTRIDSNGSFYTMEILSKNCTVSGLNLSRAYWANVYVASSGCEVNNITTYTGGRGVDLRYVDNCSVSDSRFINLNTDILLIYCENVSVFNNYGKRDLPSGGTGIKISRSRYNNIFENEFVSHNGPGIELYLSQWNRISRNWNYDHGSGSSAMYISQSENNTITENYLDDNYCNVQLRSSNNNMIENNYLNYTGWFNLYLYEDSHNNTIRSNRLNGSNFDGIVVGGESTLNEITGNVISECNHNGVIFGRDSRNNTVHRNIFIDNGGSSQGYDKYSNKWDHRMVGNYWSDYTGIDDNENHIGDTSYPINGDGNSTDRYPMMIQDPTWHFYRPIAQITEFPEIIISGHEFDLVGKVSGAWVSITEYLWNSSVDGVISRGVWASAKAELTSTRVHEITLTVKDNNKNWSLPASVTIFVRGSKDHLLVDDDLGPGIDFANLQDALSISEVNEVIRVNNGTYLGPVEIERPVSIIGNGSMDCTVISQGKRGLVINSGQVFVEGLKITAAKGGAAAVELEGIDNVSLSDLYIDSKGQGIRCMDCEAVRINNARILSVDDGLELSNCSDITLDELIITDTNRSGIKIDDSDDITLVNSTIRRCSNGISIDTSNNLVIERVKVSNCSNKGIRMLESDRNTVKSCCISGNHEHGVFVDKGSDHNVIAWNLFNNNGGNGSQAYNYEASNVWHSDFKGNFWSDHNNERCDGTSVGFDNYYFEGQPGTHDLYPLTAPNVTRGSDVWYVDTKGKDCTFSRIGDAIKKAAPNETVVIRPGTYEEYLYIDKPLNITGSGPSSTILDATDTDTNAVSLRTQGIRISGFTIQADGGYPCIYVGSSHAWIQDNHLQGGSHGVRLLSTSRANITDNTLLENSIAGIDLDSAMECTVANNFIQDCGVGIRMYNKKLGKTYEMEYGGSMSEYSANRGGHLLYGNDIKGSTTAINIYMSIENEVRSNTCTKNEKGLYLFGSSYNKITDNEFSSNSEQGIEIEGWRSEEYTITTYIGDRPISTRSHFFQDFSSSNLIMGNEIHNNPYGVVMASYSYHNKILLNNFTMNGNEPQAVDHGSNHWSNETTGNYWSNYQGKDNDRDGIGDEPYQIGGTNGSIDHRPIVRASADPPEEDTTSGTDTQMIGMISGVSVAIIVILVVIVLIAKRGGKNKPKKKLPAPPADGYGRNATARSSTKSSPKRSASAPSRSGSVRCSKCDGDMEKTRHGDMYCLKCGHFE